MKPKNSKERLFEVMQRVAPDFTSKALNEDVNSIPKELQQEIISLISDIETNYETMNAGTITDALYFDYKFKDRVNYQDLHQFVRNKMTQWKEVAKQDGDYISAGRNPNAPEDTGVGERPLTNQHGEYMGMHEGMNLSTKDGKSIKVEIPNNKEIFINGKPIEEILEVVGDVPAVGNFPAGKIDFNTYFNWITHRPDGVSEETFNNNRLFRVNIEYLVNEYEKYKGEEGIYESKKNFKQGRGTKKRLFEVMGRLDKTFKPKLNEGSAFNDAGEPLMTHQQFRDYSEPAEPEYDDQNDYERPQTKDDIINAVQKHFNTVLRPYEDGDYYFMRNTDVELFITIKNGNVSAYGADDKVFEENLDELDINDLINFLEPYKQYILTGSEAEAALNKEYEQDARDAQYARQERAAMGGGG